MCGNVCVCEWFLLFVVLQSLRTLLTTYTHLSCHRQGLCYFTFLTAAVQSVWGLFSTFQDCHHSTQYCDTFIPLSYQYCTLCILHYCLTLVARHKSYSSAAKYRRTSESWEKKSKARRQQNIARRSIWPFGRSAGVGVGRCGSTCRMPGTHFHKIQYSKATPNW